MKIFVKTVTILAVLFVAACSNDDDFTPQKKTYELLAVGGSTVAGTVTFTERENGSTTVMINITAGLTSGKIYNAHIHGGTSAEGGLVNISLDDITGETAGTAESSTTVTTLDSGTEVSFEDLLNYDGYINIHDGGSVVATVDIGQNELTAKNTQYSLAQLGMSGVSGTATFFERANGEALLVIVVAGQPLTTYNAFIRNNAGLLVEIDLGLTDGGSYTIVKNIATITGGAGNHDGYMQATSTSAEGFDGRIDIETVGGVLVAQSYIGSGK